MIKLRSRAEYETTSLGEDCSSDRISDQDIELLLGPKNAKLLAQALSMASMLGYTGDDEIALNKIKKLLEVAIQKDLVPDLRANYWKAYIGRQQLGTMV